MSGKKTSWILGLSLLFMLAGASETFAAWDGKTKTRPSKTEMVGKKEFFLIENEANLAWFADSVNSTEGSVSANAKLVANLDMGQNLFVPIAAGILQYFFSSKVRCIPCKIKNFFNIIQRCKNLAIPVH